MRQYYVYILANAWHTLYVGVTSDLRARVEEHKTRAKPGFTARYGIDRLVYYETTHDVGDALEREKQLKRWARHKKVFLIERANPTWEDLAEAW
jgi:putative endonuclease